jgi:hypothetical protein
LTAVNYELAPLIYKALDSSFLPDGRISRHVRAACGRSLAAVLKPNQSNPLGAADEDSSMHDCRRCRFDAQRPSHRVKDTLGLKKWPYRVVAVIIVDDGRWEMAAAEWLAIRPEKLPKAGLMVCMVMPPGEDGE